MRDKRLVVQELLTGTTAFLFFTDCAVVCKKWIKSTIPKGWLMFHTQFPLTRSFHTFEIIFRLLNEPLSYVQASDKSTAFHLACSQGNLETIQLLASHDPSICRITLIDSEGQTPLHKAAAKNHVQVVEYLLNQVNELRPINKKLNELVKRS